MDETNYTLPGVIHYLQEQYSIIESNRIKNDLKEAELKLKVAQLEGERNAYRIMNDKLRAKIESLEKDTNPTETLVSEEDPLSGLKLIDPKSIVESRKYLKTCTSELLYLLDSLHLPKSENETHLLDFGKQFTRSSAPSEEPQSANAIESDQETIIQPETPNPKRILKREAAMVTTPSFEVKIDPSETNLISAKNSHNIFSVCPDNSLKEWEIQLNLGGSVPIKTYLINYRVLELVKTEEHLIVAGDNGIYFYKATESSQSGPIYCYTCNPVSIDWSSDRLLLAEKDSVSWFKVKFSGSNVDMTSTGSVKLSNLHQISSCILKVCFCHDKWAVLTDCVLLMHTFKTSETLIMSKNCLISALRSNIYAAADRRKLKMLDISSGTESEAELPDLEIVDFALVKSVCALRFSDHSILVYQFHPGKLSLLKRVKLSKSFGISSKLAFDLRDTTLLVGKEDGTLLGYEF